MAHFTAKFTSRWQ